VILQKAFVWVKHRVSAGHTDRADPAGLSRGTALCLPSATHLADFSLYFYWTKCPSSNFPLS